MKFGISMPPFGDFANVERLASAARSAENAGWDGFFIWDHMIYGPSFPPIPSTWVALTAIAMITDRIRLGALVTPIARRRPWNLARETVSLDHLSRGRLIVGVGLGDPVHWDFGFFGEGEDARIRAEKLDEGLDILTGLWSGHPFNYAGKHFHLDTVIFQPSSRQQPRIPIWVGGGWDKSKPMRRAARYDGFFPLKYGSYVTEYEWRTIMTTVREQRPDDDAPFDWIHSGYTPGNDPNRAAEVTGHYAGIGITWWMENVDPFRFGMRVDSPWRADFTEQMMARIQQGPPRFT
jgi:hypothetical protein